MDYSTTHIYDTGDKSIGTYGLINTPRSSQCSPPLSKLASQSKNQAILYDSN